MRNPVHGATVAQRWGYTGLSSNGPYYDNRYSPARYYPSGFHTGIDLSAPSGTIIRNMEHGVVRAASWQGCEPNGGCWGYGGGYVAIIQHNSVPVFTSHAHMKKLYVKAGQPVHKGQAIGVLDTMGNASGPHDHCSVWIRGLWYTVNRAYTLDPWRVIYGATGDKPMLNPASCRVPLDVNLRSGPGPAYPRVGVGRQKTVLPMFKSVHGGVPAGHSSDRWRLVWYGRWCYVYQPLTTVVRAAAPSDDDLLELGAAELAEVGDAGAGWHEDRSLVSVAPSPETLSQPEPSGLAFRVRSNVAHLADADNVF